MTTPFPRPRLVVSRCLELDACRYNGQTARAALVRRLEPFVELVPTCPEVEIGLGVPREPVRLVADGTAGMAGAVRLVQPSTGRDVTDAMAAFGHAFLDEIGTVDGFLLKSRSPSCGPADVKIYGAPEKAPPVGRGPGLFAAAVLERWPHLPVEDEGRLTNLEIREAFLLRLFAMGRLRTLGPEPSMARLVAFHAAHKLVLMAYDQARLRELGRMVANPDGAGGAAIMTEYASLFRRALSRAPGRGAHLNVIMHAKGYVSEELSSDERAHFSRLERDYIEQRVPLIVLQSLLRSWVARFGVSYLADQVYFAPFPRELIDPLDSGAVKRMAQQ